MDNKNRITYFAETDARNKKTRFGIKSEDRLKHVYTIGKTGMGKSTMLENMAIQDIQNGEGLMFIDPHGKTAELLLEYIPEERIKDVVYFAPFDTDYPIAFNVMEDVGPARRHLVANGLMSTFEKIWADAWSARMSYILSNTILALLEYPDSTLLGINRMYTDKDFRKKVVDNVTDESVKSFWIDEFAKYTDRYAQEATPAIQNKIGQFISNPLIRDIIGQPKSTFDLREIMDKRKIVIVNLSKGQVGEGNANLIGSMFITKTYLAAMSRSDVPEDEMQKLPNFYLYVDEFQSFANKSFADILSEARKYKLNLTIAHQYIEQMEEEVRAAVFGNVGTMISFRVGSFDAEILEKEFAPTFTAEDLVNLGFAQVYLKLMIDGVASQPFSAATLPPIGKPENSFKKQVVENSRNSFARPKDVVQKEIKDWYAKKMSPKASFDKKPKENSDKKYFERGDDKFSKKDRDRNRKTENSYVKSPGDVKDSSTQSHNESKKEYKPFEKVFKNKNENFSVKDKKEDSPKPISLKDLSTENRQKNKGPTQKNLSELREALSSVMAKKPVGSIKQPVAREERKEGEKKPANEKEVKTGSNKDFRQQPQKSEQKTPIHQVEEDQSSVSNSKNEIPEEALKKILGQ